MPIQSKLGREQILFHVLGQLVEQDSVVSVIDLFCQCINYETLDFVMKANLLLKHPHLLLFIVILLK